MPERLGLVSEITQPPEGTNRPWSAKIGNRKVKFWGTQFESPEPSAILILLRDAENRGLTVKVTGDETQLQGPKGSYTSFTAREAEIVEGVTSAAQTSFQAPSDDRDRIIQAQSARRDAVALAQSGAIPVEAISTQTSYLFYLAQELAEGKATGNDPGEQKAE